jgi:hypothetical protein
MTTTGTTDFMEAVRIIGTTLDKLADNPVHDQEGLKAAADMAWAVHLTLLERAREERNAREQAARVRVRMDNVWHHIEAMRRERQGWGAEADAAIGRTALSWARARNMLDAAVQVWCDGGSGLSFGGYTAWGTTFGCIARPVTERCPAPVDGFAHVEMEWTFHE